MKCVLCLLPSSKSGSVNPVAHAAVSIKDWKWEEIGRLRAGSLEWAPLGHRELWVWNTIKKTMDVIPQHV